MECLSGASRVDTGSVFGYPAAPGFALHGNGHGWQQDTAPGNVGASPLMVPDGRSGVWMGPWAHWTGTGWVNTAPGPSLAGENAVTLAGLARVPGQSTLWGAGYVSRTPTSTTFDTLIAVYGKTP